MVQPSLVDIHNFSPPFRAWYTRFWNPTRFKKLLIDWNKKWLYMTVLVDFKRCKSGSIAVSSIPQTDRHTRTHNCVEMNLWIIRILTSILDLK